MRALEGQHAVVTGGGRGIGAAVAMVLAQQGATLTLMGRDARRLEAQAGHLGAITRVRSIVVDVKDATSVEAGFGGAVDAAGPINILINNAGAVATASFGKTDAGLWNEMLAVNLTGTSLLPAVIGTGTGDGRVVNIASTAGLTGYAYVTGYCAAEHGVVGLTPALAMETEARTSR